MNRRPARRWSRPAPAGRRGSIGAARAHVAPRGEAGLFQGGARGETERTESAGLQARLGHVDDADWPLLSLADLETALARTAELAVPLLADSCVVELLRGRSRVRVVAAAPAHAARRGSCRTLDPRARNGADRVMTTGKAEIAARSTLDSRSRMVVPIAFGDRVLGAISFESSSRTFVGEDLVLAWDLARRAGRAIENARSFERTKRSLRMRDEFLGIVSHDVKGLLGSIKLNATLIERLGDARTRKMAGSIGRITDRMGRLVNDLLDVASIEAGKLRIVPTDCSAAGLVREVVETFAPIAAEKSVRLVSRGSQAVRVSCDRGRILQALANLVSNAIKFTPAGGTVAVAARKRRGEVVFSVADTGPGIASEQRNRLFRHFSPGDPSDRRGVGLGLYIARALVEEHGGRIGVRTSPGDGSEFFFSLPR